MNDMETGINSSLWEKWIEVVTKPLGINGFSLFCVLIVLPQIFNQELYDVILEILV